MIASGTDDIEEARRLFDDVRDGAAAPSDGERFPILKRKRIC